MKVTFLKLSLSLLPKTFYEVKSYRYFVANYPKYKILQNYVRINENKSKFKIHYTDACVMHQ